ncbi:unnamed protein product, partial [Clonostachys rhizophaga]
ILRQAASSSRAPLSTGLDSTHKLALESRAQEEVVWPRALGKTPTRPAKVRRSRCLRGKADAELAWKDAVVGGCECQPDRVGAVTTAEVTVVIMGTACSIYSIARIAYGVVYVLIEDDSRGVMRALV